MSAPRNGYEALQAENAAYQKEVASLNREAEGLRKQLEDAQAGRPGCLCGECDLRRDPYPGRHICGNEDCPCYLETVPATFGCSMGVRAA